jgi:hypothetical protein
MMSPLRIQKLLENLAQGEDDIFKNGLSQELNIRKNELCKAVASKIFESFTDGLVDKNIDINEDVKKLINILEQLKKNKTVKIEFKNASIINISESDIAPIKLLFDNLNEANQKLLAKNIFDSPAYFKSTMQFAKGIRGLLT